MSYLGLPRLIHIDISVNRVIKIIFICEILCMIFSGGDKIYDFSSSGYGFIVNDLTPSVITSCCYTKLVSYVSHTEALLVVSMRDIDLSSYSLALGSLDGK